MTRLCSTSLLKWVKRRPAVAALWFLAFVTAAMSITANIVQYRQAKTAQTIVQYRQAKTAQTEAENALSVGDVTLNVALAYRELQDNHHDYAVDLLDRCPERFRYWEWHYLRRMAQPTPVERRNTLLTPDGRVVTGFPWIIDYEPNSKNPNSKNNYPHFQFSGDGHYVAILDDPPRSVKIWNTITGALVQAIRTAANEKLKPVSFIKNDKFLVVHATGGDADTRSEDRCFDVKSGKLIRTLPLGKGTYTYSPHSPFALKMQTGDPSFGGWHLVTSSRAKRAGTLMVFLGTAVRTVSGSAVRSVRTTDAWPSRRGATR
jgi:hypothetical protein